MYSRILAFLLALVMGGALLGGSSAYAQGGFVRLNTTQANGTIDANGDSVTLTSDLIGGFGSIKIQTLDTYSGTWEVQCATDEALTFDTDNELGMSLLDDATTVYSVTDTVGIWTVHSAAGCRAIRVIATAGFAASDTKVQIRATQTGGAGAGGGGGGPASEVTVTALSIGGVSASIFDLTNSNPIATQLVDANGDAITSIGGGTQYTEADTDATITGNALMFESNTGTNALSVVSNSAPLPVSDAGGALTVDNGGTFAVQAAQSGTWNITNVSGTVSLPTGAATETTLGGVLTSTNFAAAFGTAGTADSQVMSIQGIASMTPVQVESNAAAIATETTLASIDSTLSTGISVSGTVTTTSDDQQGDDDNVAYALTLPTVMSLLYCDNGSNWERCNAGDGGEGVLTSNTTRVTLATDDEVNDSLNNDPCEYGAKVYFTTQITASTELFAGTASNRTYLCSMLLHNNSSAEEQVALVSGTGTTCDTSTAGIQGMGGGSTATTGYRLASGGGYTFGNGGATIGKTGTDGHNVCLLKNSTGSFSVGLSYVVAAN